MTGSRDDPSPVPEPGWRVVSAPPRTCPRSARALYTSFGFVVVGRRRRYYRDGEDAVASGRVPASGDARAAEGKP